MGFLHFFDSKLIVMVPIFLLIILFSKEGNDLCYGIFIHLYHCTVYSHLLYTCIKRFITSLAYCRNVKHCFECYLFSQDFLGRSDLWDHTTIFKLSRCSSLIMVLNPALSAQLFLLAGYMSCVIKPCQPNHLETQRIWVTSKCSLSWQALLVPSSHQRSLSR